MEKLPDWQALWSELSGIQSSAFSRKREDADDDFWKHKAKDFDKMVEDRWSTPDSSRDFIVRKLQENPGATLLDIGAGTGKWSLFCAPYAGKVTAFDPSLAMQAVLKEKIAARRTDNIEIITGSWPPDPGSAPVEPHDFLLASHSMYGVADFRAFVHAMNKYAKKGCILVMRAPFYSSIMAKAALRVWGQPYDSPNFQIAYNILLAMDIFPDVVMEADGTWPGWNNDSFEAALDELKGRLDLTDDPTHDRFLTGLLKETLIMEEGRVRWPAGNRSALLYWEV